MNQSLIFIITLDLMVNWWLTMLVPWHGAKTEDYRILKAVLALDACFVGKMTFQMKVAVHNQAMELKILPYIHVHKDHIKRQKH